VTDEEDGQDRGELGLLLAMILLKNPYLRKNIGKETQRLADEEDGQDRGELGLLLAMV
jgi:hypothetical protein